MMPKAQPATDAAGGQKIMTWATQAVGTAIPAGAPDGAAIARPVPPDRSATAAASGASSALESATAPAAFAPGATIPGGAMRTSGIAPAPASTPTPGTVSSRTAAAAHSLTWQANLARLEGLAEVLSHHGLRARLMTPPGRVPSLHVVNPTAAALAEDVYAGRGQDGLWWFWWSWAERIAMGEDLEGAASMIEHVLAASG